MNGLFLPSVKPSENDVHWFHVELDPVQPFLADHRPGGAPLFGTVMQMEALACAAQQVISGSIRSIHHVRVAKPYIIHDESAEHGVAIQVRRSVEAPHLQLDCKVVSRRPGVTDDIHMEATVSAKPREASQGQTSKPPRLRPERGILEGSAVYRLFFHGRSFQVIDAAQWQDGAMVCELTRHLPPSHFGGGASLISPRLIELGLQTAGLLELASSGRMMIPHYLQRIERLCELDVEAANPLYAVAKRAEDSASINIAIMDGMGTDIMLIKDYRTVALPFAADADACATLAAALRETAGGI